MVYLSVTNREVDYTQIYRSIDNIFRWDYPSPQRSFTHCKFGQISHFKIQIILNNYYLIRRKS